MPLHPLPEVTVKRPPEFPTACADCGGPLLEISTDRIFDRPPGPRLPVWVHARHRDWSARPHCSVPVDTTGTVVASLAAVRAHRQRRATGRRSA